MREREQERNESFKRCNCSGRRSIDRRDLLFGRHDGVGATADKGTLRDLPAGVACLQYRGSFHDDGTARRPDLFCSTDGRPGTENGPDQYDRDSGLGRRHHRCGDLLVCRYARRLFWGSGTFQAVAGVPLVSNAEFPIVCGGRVFDRHP